MKYARHAKTSNFAENFGSGMVRVGSIRVSGPLSGEHTSRVGSGPGPGHSVRVSGLGSVLPGLIHANSFSLFYAICPRHLNRVSRHLKRIGVNEAGYHRYLS